MKSVEVRKLTRQILALILAFSLAAGMQPAIASAAEEQKTITNIELVTKDQAESYTFYNGFNDNWYMAPGTQLNVTYNDESEKTVNLHRAFLKAEKNSAGHCAYGQSYEEDYSPNDDVWDDYSPFLGSEYATSPFENIDAEPFTIVYDEGTNTVSARTETESFTLYKPRYKSISEMPTLSTTKETVAEGARYMRFYRVSGTPGTAYETYTTKTDENDSIDTMLCAYKENGAFVSSDDDSGLDCMASLAYRFTEETPSYVIGLMGYHHNYVLYTKLYTKVYNALKQIQLASSAIVYPQFESCTVDYKFKWEDGTESEKRSIYATGYDYLDGCYVSYAEKEEEGETVYGLAGRDRTNQEIFTAFPSGTKVMKLDKGNTANYPVYRAGEKVALKPGETKMMYMNAVEGSYFMANNSTRLEVMVYSLAEQRLMYEFYNRGSKKLSGEYALLVTNASEKVANFRLLNLDDAAQTKSIPEYKPGQEVALAEYEEALYRFTAGSTYIYEIKGYSDGSSILAFIVPKKDGYFLANGILYNHEDERELKGEGFFLVQNSAGEKTITLKDVADPSKNVSGAAAKETWAGLQEEQQKNPGTAQPATPTPDTKQQVDKPVDQKETSIKGKTSTVSHVTYKAISDSEASLSKVKKVKTITSYKVPKTVSINGKKVKVTTIESNAFKNSKKLKKVTLSANVTTIKANAFKNCKKLKTIVVENANALKIKKNAFKGCKTITFKVKKSQIKKFSKKLKKAKIGCKYKVKKK